MTCYFSQESDLAKLFNLGHFLKGSAATLGLIKVRDACERIQYFGAHKDETGSTDELDDQKCLVRAKQAFEEARSAFDSVSQLLRRFYDEEA